MSQELERAHRVASFEARALGCTTEQFRRAAYDDPKPSASWASEKPLTPEEEALQKRLKRWNGG